MEDRDYQVTVCDKCLKAVCWHGEMMCFDSGGAGTIDLPASKLDELGKEHPSYYTKKRLLKITGDSERYGNE